MNIYIEMHGTHSVADANADAIANSDAQCEWILSGKGSDCSQETATRQLQSNSDSMGRGDCSQESAANPLQSNFDPGGE